VDVNYETEVCVKLCLLGRVFKLRPERGSVTRSNIARQEIHEFQVDLLLALPSTATPTLKIGY
jgi:hypothetical protein